MSYVSVGYSVYDSIVAGKNVDPEAKTFADFWAEQKAKFEAARAAEAAAQQKVALEKAQLGKASAEAEKAVSDARLAKARAAAELKALGPPPPGTGGLFGLSPTMLVVLGAVGYFVFVHNKKGRRGRR